MKAARRQNSSSAPMQKQEFLNKWINGLQIYTTLNNQMTISERKNAIKLSADVAIASTSDNISTNWSRALMANVVSKNAGDGAGKAIVERISGRKIVQNNNNSNNNNNNNNKGSTMMACSKRIMRRSRMARRKKAAIRSIRSVRGTSGKAGSIARRLVKKRTRVLKRLVPGGDEMDGVDLIKETLDYVASLQVQVDVMRKIADVAERLDPPQMSF